MMGTLIGLYRRSKRYLEGLRGERRAVGENPNHPLYALTVPLVKSGVTVTEDTALGSTVVLACVRVIAETIGSLPLLVYRRLQPRGKERAPDHPLYSLLHDRPNPYMSAMSWRETMLGHALLRGNGYSEIEWSGGGEVRALWPLRPDRTRPVVDQRTGELWYETWIRGEPLRLPPERVLHVPGLSFDGIRGYSVVSLGREAIGLTLAQEQYAAGFYGNNAAPGGVLQRPIEAPNLSEEAKARLRQDWETMHRGLTNAHRVAVLEEGTTWQQVGVSPEDAQAVESRVFQVPEICRLFRVPPHKVQHLKEATFNNIEHLAIEFVVDTIRPWCVRLEQAMNYRLMLPAERTVFFIEHLIDGLLRGDIKARYEAYAIGRQWGALSADDWRELENMNPLPDQQGEIYLVPLNMVPADTLVGSPRQPQAGTAPAPRAGVAVAEVRALKAARARRAVVTPYSRLFVEAAARVIRRERNDVLTAARKQLAQRDLAQFTAWLAEFYREHRTFVTQQFAPLHAALSDSLRSSVGDELGKTLEGDNAGFERFRKEYVEAFAERHAESSRGQLEAVAREAAGAGEDPVAAVEKRFAEWEEKRPGKIAQWEIVRAENAFTKHLYAAAGVTRIRWVAFGDKCPYCRSLHGRTVSISADFLGAGAFKPEGAEKPLSVGFGVGHPPAHEGCDCSIAAG